MPALQLQSSHSGAKACTLPTKTQRRKLLSFVNRSGLTQDGYGDGYVLLHMAAGV